jgi:esterase/lipase
MISNSIDRLTTENNQPFSDYIVRCRATITKRRPDLQQPSVFSDRILNANSPFELYPPHLPNRQGRIKRGALLIHGLLDCPFSLRDIGSRLQASGVLCRSILLPGHGTVPSDLISITYQDWVKAMHYGLETLRREVDQVYLVGYSTGAALSIYQAMQDPKIAGIILLAPAIRIKIPADMIIGWHYLLKWFTRNNNWLHQEVETDYTKYLSIAYNGVRQVSLLTDTLKDSNKNPIHCPIFMAISREDETISSHDAIDFFSSQNNADSQLLLYTSNDRRYPDPRIIARDSRYPDLNVKHFSHVSLPFAPTNLHYGQQGDYLYASRPETSDCEYGAYNHVESQYYDFLYKMKFISRQHHELTYNPDFNFMAEKITEFVLRQP